jgi:hypothetical protein
MFLRFWKKHYPLLVIQKPSEDICGDCHTFANSYKTIISKQKKQASKSNTDSDDSTESDAEDKESTASVPNLDDDDDTGKNSRHANGNSDANNIHTP